MMSKSIFDIPLPTECKNWFVSGTVEYAVRDIEMEEFKPLNDLIVMQVPRHKAVQRRKVDKVTRKFATNDDGYVFEEYKVPTGSSAVVSNRCLDLSYDWFKINNKDGYGYVDYFTPNGKRMYIYVLPKEVLYKANQTALVVSKKSSMKCYSGVGYKTWKYGMLYLYVIPYNPNVTYAESIVLKTGLSTNYIEERDILINYWQSIDLIPNLALAKLSDDTSLVEKPIGSTYNEYIAIELLPLSKKEILGDDTNGSQE